MLTEYFVIHFDDVKTMDVNLIKIKHQIIFELMCRRKERLRALLENVKFEKMSGMKKHQVLHETIKQLKEISPAESRFLDNVERQVRWVLNTYYNWII